MKVSKKLLFSLVIVLVLISSLGTGSLFGCSTQAECGAYCETFGNCGEKESCRDWGAFGVSCRCGNIEAGFYCDGGWYYNEYN